MDTVSSQQLLCSFCQTWGSFAISFTDILSRSFFYDHYNIFAFSYLFGLDFRVDNEENDYVFSKCKPVLGKQINFPWFHIRLVPFKVIEKENTMQWHDFLANISWFLGQIVPYIHICKSPHWSTLTFHRLNMPFQTKCHKKKHFLFVFFFVFNSNTLINICKFGADKMERVIFNRHPILLKMPSDEWSNFSNNQIIL